jgi:hypothetical protein
MSHFNEKHKQEIFEQCKLCNKWIKVSKTSFVKENGKQYHFSNLMGAPDHSNRWVCSECWNIIDVAKYGPYIRSRPK